MDLTLFSQNYANEIASNGGDKKKAMLKVGKGLVDTQLPKLSAELERSIASLEAELNGFYPKVLSKFPLNNGRGYKLRIPNPINPGSTTEVDYDEVLNLSKEAAILSMQARKYYEEQYRYGVGASGNVAEVKIPSTPITSGVGLRVSITPGDQAYRNAALTPELTTKGIGAVAKAFDDDNKRARKSISEDVKRDISIEYSRSPAANLNQRLRGLETFVKLVATEAKKNGADPKDANNFVQEFMGEIEDLRTKSLKAFVDISAIVQKEQSYVQTREEIYGIFDARRKKDYYSKVTNTAADSRNPKVYDPAKVQSDIDARKSTYEKKIGELETVGVSTMEDIVKLQENFIFPRYAIKELENTGFFSKATADQLRIENQETRTGKLVTNTTSVLPTAYTPKPKVPSEWKTYPTSSEIDVPVYTPGVAGVLNDSGARGKGFNDEAVKVVFGMIDTYQKRVLDVDKKRVEIAKILWDKTNGAAGAITNENLVEYPLVGNYTIADEITTYLSRSDLSQSERKKMESLKVDLAKLLVGENDPLFPEKGPLLPLANKIRTYAHSLGIAEKDEKNGKYGLVFDFTASGERAEDGQVRAAIFDPLMSAQAQVYKTIGRQHITDDDKVSNFAFDITDDERQIHPKGHLGSLANDELLLTSVDVEGKSLTLRSNSGFVEREAWKELVGNTNDSAVEKKKEEVEAAFRADMYRNFAEKTLKDSWRTEFKNQFIAQLSGPGGIYEGLSGEEIERMINKGDSKNTKLSEGGNILGSFSNLDLLADLSLETFTRTYGQQISSLQEILKNNNRMRGLPGGIADVDPVELYKFAERRFGGSTNSVTREGIQSGIDQNIQQAFRYIQSLKHGNQTGYFSPIKTLDDNLIELALGNVGRSMAEATFVPLKNENLRIGTILPTSNMHISLELDQAGVPFVKYKEHRLVNYDGEVTPENIDNVIKVVKELEAREMPSEHIMRVLGNLNGAQSNEMVKLLNDTVKFDEKTKKFIIKPEAESKTISGDAAKNSDQISKNLNNWATSWMLGTEAADIALKAYSGPLGGKTIRRDITDPLGIIDDALTKKPNLGLGLKLKEDLAKWTSGDQSTWVNLSYVFDPKTKPNKEKWVDRQRIILDSWKETLIDGNLFVHFKKTGALPGLNVPFFLGNKPLIGDYEGNGLKILTDMTGGAAVDPSKWVTTRFGNMIGTRAVIDGKEVNVTGYRILNGWEQGVNRFVNDSWIGKTAQLGKKHQYEKRKDKSLFREITTLALDATIGLLKVGAIKVGQALLEAPVIGRALRYTGNLPIVTESIQNVSKTLTALKAVSPIARAATVGLTNAGIVGIPVWFIAGGGIPGVAAGLVSGGLWGASKGLAILAKPETSAAIEKFMGFERLNNIALNEQYLIKIGGSASDALRTTSLTTGKLIAGEKNIANLFATSAYWDEALVKAGGYLEWLSPSGAFGKSLKWVYNQINEVTPQARLFNAYGSEGTRLATAQKVVGSLGRASIVGAAAYAISGGGLWWGAGSLLGYAAVENAARRIAPSIAVKLQFLGETATGRTLSNALTKINDFRVHFPLLDTLAIVQTSNYFNEAILIPTTQLLRGNMPLNVYLWGGTSSIDLSKLSLAEARSLGVTDRAYFNALNEVKQSGYTLKPELKYFYKGLLSSTSIAEMFFYLGAGYIPVVSAYSSAVYTLAQRLGIKSVWGGWYANRFETVAEKSILWRMKNSKGLIKILGDAIDNPFGALPEGVRTGIGYTLRAGGAIAGGYGGYLFALTLGITNPLGIGAFVAGGAIGGYVTTSLIVRGATNIWNNVLTHWMRVPLVAGSGLMSYFSPLIGGGIGAGVSYLAGFGTAGTLVASSVGAIVGSLILPGVGSMVGFAVGVGITAVSSYVSGVIGDWVGNWWNKTTGLVIDGLNSISPILAIVRVFNALNRADLGQFVTAVFQLAYSFSVGIAATGVVLTAVVPPLITPSAPPVAGGTYFLPCTNLVSKVKMNYNKVTNTVSYRLNFDPTCTTFKEGDTIYYLQDTIDDGVLTVTKSDECDSSVFEVKDKEVRLVGGGFDTKKSYCLDYSVVPSKKISEYSQYCNSVFAEISTESEKDKKIFHTEFKLCVDKNGAAMPLFYSIAEGGDYSNGVGGIISAPPSSIGNGNFPVNPNDPGVVLSQCSYGGSGSTHSVIGALDISGPINTAIYSWDEGEVMAAGTFNKYGSKNGGAIYGYMIIIKHPNNIATMYGHLNAISVKVGDQVKKGQAIGRMGHSTDPKFTCNMGVHLHWEIRKWSEGGSPDPCSGMVDCTKYSNPNGLLCGRPGYVTKPSNVSVGSAQSFINLYYTDQQNGPICNWHVGNYQ